jgi:hypothetical protein
MFFNFNQTKYTMINHERKPEEDFFTWPWKLKMSTTKRKARSSLKLMDFEDEDRGSPIEDKRKQMERETSPGRMRGNSEGEGYENDDIKLRHGRTGAQRPLPRGYQPHPYKMQPHPAWKGRYSPGYYQRSSSSFAGGSYCRFRSLVLYGRLVEQGAWWSEGREE